MEQVAHPEKKVLIHWSYSNDEWLRFIRWQAREKGALHYWFCRIKHAFRHKRPEVIITRTNVCRDGCHQPFHGADRQFREIGFYDAGDLNVVEIGYLSGNKYRGIKIPVPKGKLREAISLQDRINILHHS